MKLNLSRHIGRAVTATVGSVLALVLVFQVAFAGGALAANLPSSDLIASNASKMADQVQEQIGMQRDRLARDNSKSDAKPRKEQNVTRPVDRKNLDIVEPTVEDPTKGEIGGMADVEKSAKLAGVKAVEKVGAAVGNDNRGFEGKK